MKRRIPTLLVLPFIVLTFAVNTFAEAEIPEKKQTTLGLYVTAQEAFTKWKADPEGVKVLDVRTPGEYMFVGHAPMASNIPLMYLKAEYDTAKKRPVMPFNKIFVEEVSRKYKKTDNLYVMCRSGGRSAFAVNLLAKAGFENVYNIIDGFEGDALNIDGSYNNGQRLVNGWKNCGAPWTYKMNPDLMYLP